MLIDGVSKQAIMPTIRSVVVALLVFFLLFSILSMDGSSHGIERSGLPVHRVAHAGGSVNGETYLNSIQALDKNFDKGFRYFELDLVLTTDNKVVCMRDWGDDFFSAFGFYTPKRLSYREFVVLANRTAASSRRCHQSTLLRWLEVRSGATIITDFKSHNILGLLVLMQNFPKGSVIPQAYSITELDLILSMGYEDVIWTLYRERLTDDEVVEQVKNNHNVSVITMPEDRARHGLPARLGGLGISSYVHTVNDIPDFYFYKLNGVTEIYTDFLTPVEVPSPEFE